MGGRQTPNEIGEKIIDDLSYVVKEKKYLFASRPNIVKKWDKYEMNPVLGGNNQIYFDVCVLLSSSTIENRYSMYFSWRNDISIALTTSVDGISWDPTYIRVLEEGSSWDTVVNRPFVLYHNSSFKMWFTGQVPY